MDNKITAPTVEKIQAILKWKGKIHSQLPQEEIPDAFGPRWGFSHQLVEEFKQDLVLQGFVQDFEWGKWQTKAVKLYENNPRLIAVDLVTVVQLFTLHVRKDRFCSGHFDQMIECGHMQALLSRLDYFLHGLKPITPKQLEMCHQRYRDLQRKVYEDLGRYARQAGSVWTSPTRTLRQTDVLILGINPGAGNPQNHGPIDEFGKLEVTKGGRDSHGYLVNKDGEQHILGKRLEHLLDAVGVSLADVPTTNLIFRLSKSAEGIGFLAEAARCWPVHEWILDIIQPKVILSLGNSNKSAYGYIKKHICKNHEIQPLTPKSIGWGKVRVKGYNCRLRGRPVTVIGLPHPSRYDLQHLGNTACSDMVRNALQQP